VLTSNILGHTCCLSWTGGQGSTLKSISSCEGGGRYTTVQ
jgi:hypothetical protein